MNAARSAAFLPLLLLFLFPSIPARSASSAPAGPQGPPAREITIRECVEAALRSNVDIAVWRAEKEIGAQGIPIEAAAFLPRFSGELNASRSVSPNGSSLAGTFTVDQRVYNFNVTAADLLPIGATLSAAFQNQRQELSSAIAGLSPQYSTALTLSAQYPLLKNRGRRVTEAPLRIARLGAEAMTGEWKAKVMDVVAAARSAFLSLSVASRESDVRRSALDLAERLLARTRARIEAGAAAPVDLLPSEAAAASRREELQRAEAAARNAADDLRSVLGMRTDREWEEALLPAPLVGEVPPPGAAETVDEAMRRRPEVGAQEARREQAAIQEAVARSRALPALDLSVSSGLSGLSGTPTPNPFFPGLSNPFEGNYADALDQLFSARYYNGFVGVRTEFPWRFEREKAEWARARSAAEEQRLLGDGLALRIRTEVRKGRRDLESALMRVETARVSVAAAEKALEAEEEKLALGRSTVTQVLQFQQDLSEARLAEVRARTDAYAAQTRLWRAVGVILDREGIALR